MISIGNDIIDLTHTNPERTKQEKFYSKIICSQEIELFKKINSNIISFENFVWLAWSVKESVYKFQKRCNPEFVFSPTKIVIKKIDIPLQQQGWRFGDTQLENISFNQEICFCCEVQLGSTVFYTRSIVADDVIFSGANNTNCFQNIYWGIKVIDDDSYQTQSSEVRKFALNKLSEYFFEEDLQIEKSSAGWPVVVQQNDLPISFAHHGKYVGYSFIIPAKKIRNNDILHHHPG